MNWSGSGESEAVDYAFVTSILLARRSRKKTICDEREVIEHRDTSDEEAEAMPVESEPENQSSSFYSRNRV